MTNSTCFLWPTIDFYLFLYFQLLWRNTWSGIASWSSTLLWTLPTSWCPSPWAMSAWQPPPKATPCRPRCAPRAWPSPLQPNSSPWRRPAQSTAGTRSCHLPASTAATPYRCRPPRSSSRWGAAQTKFPPNTTLSSTFQVWPRLHNLFIFTSRAAAESNSTEGSTFPGRRRLSPKLTFVTKHDIFI